MERSPIISWVFHFRVTCKIQLLKLSYGNNHTFYIFSALLFVLGALDWHFIQVAYEATLSQGASVQLVFGFEYAILVAMVTVKYALHTYDINRENPWEDKAVFLLYAELAIGNKFVFQNMHTAIPIDVFTLGFIKVILYMMFMLIMIRVYTLPLFAVRPMYLAMRYVVASFEDFSICLINIKFDRSFKKALSDVILSRRAIRNLNTLYPDATAEDLANTDTVCIICREEMVTGIQLNNSTNLELSISIVVLFRS